MKNKLILLTFMSVISMIFSSCEKDYYRENGTKCQLRYFENVDCEDEVFGMLYTEVCTDETLNQFECPSGFSYPIPDTLNGYLIGHIKKTDIPKDLRVVSEIIEVIIYFDNHQYTQNNESKDSESKYLDIKFIEKY
ncbi:MAG: hypothetical protein PHW82_14660 [Bacteroidales bacterium]|nr:hypothetical protein [Bacteroidales bacterium]